MKKYQNGAKLKAEGKYLKEKGLSSKKEGLRIKAAGQYLKTGKAKPTYKQKYSVTLPMKDFPEDKTFEKTQILNKGPKTIVNRKSFFRYAEGMQTPVSKSTTVYDKKTGKTKVSKNYKKGGKLHLGFKETQAKIAKKQGISMEAAGAILASSARKASPKAVKKNLALLNVKRSKAKKYEDGGISTVKSSKGITTKKDWGLGLPDVTHVGKKGKTMLSIDRQSVTHKGKKGNTNTFRYGTGDYEITHKGKKGTTTVSKNKNYRTTNVSYSSNKKGTSYSK